MKNVVIELICFECERVFGGGDCSCRVIGAPREYSWMKFGWISSFGDCKNHCCEKNRYLKDISLRMALL